MNLPIDNPSIQNYISVIRTTLENPNCSSKIALEIVKQLEKEIQELYKEINMLYKTAGNYEETIGKMEGKLRTPNGGW